MSVYFHSAPSVTYLSKLAVPAVRSLAVAATSACALAALRVSGARLKLTVWRSVLCVALAMPLLTIALPSMPLGTPLSMSFLNAAPAVRDTLRPLFATQESHAAAVSTTSEIDTVRFENPAPISVMHIARRGTATTGATAAKLDTIRADAYSNLELAATHIARRSLFARVRESVRSELTFARAMAIVYVAGFVVLAARMITGIVLGGRLARKPKPFTRRARCTT